MPILRVARGSRVDELPFEGQPLLGDLLALRGYALARPCGGRGLCGKCAVALDGAVSPANDAERRAGARLSCQATLIGDCEVTLPPELALEQIEGGEGAVTPACDGATLGAAVDIGTTTLALRLYDMRSREPLAAVSRANPQASVAADVMGRIEASINGGAQLLRGQITDAVAELLGEACAAARCDTQSVARMVLAGNTAMLYLLTARDTEPLSHAPFKADCLFDMSASLLGIEAYLPPCMHAFVGADITCAALACGMCSRPEASLLCDIGTNGELALWKDGILYVTSTAAGPVFEGAGITMGCLSVKGAIDRVWVEGGALGTRTIGGAPPVGVCGSGLIDAIAALLRLERIDDTGATEEPVLPLAGGVALYPKDIRAVQLAKAAIAAGIETLISEAGIQARDIQRLYVAGGFGNHIDMASAAVVGLIPASVAAKAVFVGNGSLDGASMLLLDNDAAREARSIAARARHISLGGNPLFNKLYVEHMLFGSAAY